MYELLCCLREQGESERIGYLNIRTSSQELAKLRTQHKHKHMQTINKYLLYMAKD